MILYLKSQYSTNNKNQIVLIENFPSIREMSSLEEIQEEQKIILEHIKDGENKSLRNKALFGGWIAVTKTSAKNS